MPDNVPMTLSRVIYVCGFNEHQEFAEFASIPQATLSRVVRGKQRPGPSICERFATGLEHPNYDSDSILQMWCGEFE